MKILNFWVNNLKNVKEDKFLILIPLLTIVTRLIIFIFIPHTYEDAFITFRYAENLANGFGLVYNIGEKVYGSTTPFFAIVLAAFKLIGISCIFSSLSINMISESLTSVVIYKFLKDYSKDVTAVLVSLLFIFSPSNISWSIQGMETALFTAVIALSFFALYKEKYFQAFLFSFLSAMIRIDGLSVVFIVFIFILFKLKGKTFKLILLPLTLFLVWLFSLYLYYGNFLPNSMIAKLILYSAHETSFLPNLSFILSKFFIKGYFSSSIITILFLGGVMLVFYKKINLYPMVIWFFIYYLALIFSKTTIFGWYLIPPLFVFITLSGIAIIFIAEKLIKVFAIKRSLVLSAIFLGIVLFSSITLSLKIIQIKNEYNYEQKIRMKIGQFIDQNTVKESTIFLEPIGVIGYFSKRYIYDEAALVSPVFLELNKLPNTIETRFKKIQLVKPDYLVLRNKYLKDFRTKTELFKEYATLKRYDYHQEPDYPGMTIFIRKNPN